jgi:hypothetical protein
MAARTGQRVGPQGGSREDQRPPQRVVPERNPDFEHLTLSALRAYRRTLAHEESRVSYWRRLIQARLDVVRDEAVSEDHLPDEDKVERLRGVLAAARTGESRQALVSVIPVDDIPPLPDLEELWSRELHGEDATGVERLREDLAFAELQLSAYRSALHDRLGAATQELIARYREDPGLCLAVLPAR